MDGFLQKALNQRRSMGSALADMLVEYQHNPSPQSDCFRRRSILGKGRPMRLSEALRKIAAREVSQS